MLNLKLELLKLENAIQQQGQESRRKLDTDLQQLENELKNNLKNS